MGRVRENKRRGNNAGSIYLERGRYVLMYTDPIGGKRKKKVLAAKDANGVDQVITEKSTADKAAAEFLAGIRKITAIESKAELMVKVAEEKKLINRTRLNLAEIWTTFESSPERPDSGPGTLKKYKIFCDRFTFWLKKSRHIADASQIDADTAAAFMAYLWGTGISEATCNSYRQALLLIFRVVLKEDGMENPFGRISRKTLNTQSHLDFSSEQINQIFQQLAPASGYPLLHKEQMRVFVNLCCWTGCRKQDAALMRWQAVNFNSNIISYRPLKTIRTSGKQVTIPIHPQLREALLEAESWHDKSNYILPDVAARYQSNPSGIGKDISKLIASIGLGATIDAPDHVRTKKLGKEKKQRRICQYGTHSFRHSFVSFCANAGVPMAIVQEIVGHGSPAMTRHYYHMDQAAAQRAINTLPSIGNEAQNVQAAAMREKLRQYIDFANLPELQRLQEQLLPEIHSLPADIIEAEALPELEGIPSITPERLQYLLPEYTIKAIGQIFGVSDTAIRKRMAQYGISKPDKRLQSGVLSNRQIEENRQALRKQET